MRNRVPRYPGRVTLTPVPGQANTYDLTRADQPTEAGDPLSKETFLQDVTAAAYGLGTDAVPDEVLGKLSRTMLHAEKRRIADFPDGTEFYLKENGVNSVYVKLKDNYEGSGNVAVIRRYALPTSDAIRFSSLSMPSGPYAGGELDRFLSETFLNRLDEADFIPETSLKVYPGATAAGATSLIRRKVFTHSSVELGGDSAHVYQDGARIPALQSIKLAQVGSSAYWTRSPMSTNANNAVMVDSTGAIWNSPKTVQYYVRPMLTLPPDFLVAGKEGFASIFDVLGNLLTLPSAQLDSRVQIATGSYVGTGTYGASNPTKLTFPFSPKMVVVAWSDAYPSNGGWADMALWIEGMNQTRIIGSNGAAAVQFSMSENTLRWYTTNTTAYAGAQLNVSGRAYQYVAFS